MNQSCRSANSTSFLLRVSVGLAAASVVLGAWIGVTPVYGADVWGYDSARGTDEDEILRNFNLHRGRWWNYFERGSWYLRYGHHEAAEDDFRTVVEKRPSDKRQARTYGMHFRDCFGHRELGIALYYRALEAKARGADNEEWKLLIESLDEIELSLKQANSARAEHYRKLATGNKWRARANVQKDTVAPVIQVENATAIGENVGVLYSNQRSVRLDLRVIDDKSGVGAIWINDEEVLVERSKRNLLKKVYVDVDIGDQRIRLRARDLVGNANNATYEVMVLLDEKSPTIFTASYATQTRPGGPISVKCSARDNVGLNAVRVNNIEIDCNHEHRYDVDVNIPPGLNTPRVEIQVIDLAGNTTEGYMNVFANDHKIAQPVSVAPRLLTPALFVGALPTYSPRRWGGSDILRSSRSYPAVLRTAAYTNLDMRLNVSVLEGSESPARSAEATPIFEFDESTYGSEPNGFVVTDREWKMSITLRKFGAAVECIQITVKKQGPQGKWIEVYKEKLKAGGASDTSAVVHVNPIIRFEGYGEMLVEVKALPADGSKEWDSRELFFRRVPDVTRELGSLYSVIALPLVPDGIPNNSRSEELDEKIWEAVTECKLDPGDTSRFDCTVMKKLGRGSLDLNIESDKADPVPQAIRIGRARGVDLGVCGRVTKRSGHWEVAVSLVDNGTLRTIGDILADYYLPEGTQEPDRWDKHINDLTTKLEQTLRRVRGKVTNKSRNGKKIYVDVGSERKLFRGQKLCVFNHEEKLARTLLAQAVVERVPTKGPSQAKITESGSQYYPQKGIEEDELIIITK